MKRFNATAPHVVCPTSGMFSRASPRPLCPHCKRFASNKNFTHLVVLGERAKKCNGMLLSRLPAGPTAFFKVSNVEISADLANHGRSTTHQPEARTAYRPHTQRFNAHVKTHGSAHSTKHRESAAAACFLFFSKPHSLSGILTVTDTMPLPVSPQVILNNFGTRLGRRVGRFLGSLFPHAPQFEGRQVVTFHNQRDFIFVRHHRCAKSHGPRARVCEGGGGRGTLRGNNYRGEVAWHGHRGVSSKVT